jgi:hypothetical protein
MALGRPSLGPPSSSSASTLATDPDDVRLKTALCVNHGWGTARWHQSLESVGAARRPEDAAFAAAAEALDQAASVEL